MAAVEEGHLNLENEALKRKKRLEALRQLKEQQQQQIDDSLQEQQSLPRCVCIKYLKRTTSGDVNSSSLN